jgi:hypothetical protein
MFELLDIIRFVYAQFNDHQGVSSVKIEKYALKYSFMLLSEFGILALLSKPIWFDVIAYAKFTFECRHRMWL